MLVIQRTSLVHRRWKALPGKNFILGVWLVGRLEIKFIKPSEIRPSYAA